MTDFASIGIQLDSRPVTEGAKALDALADASVRVEQRVKASNGQMNDTAKIMAAQAEQARAAAAGNATLGASTAQLTLGQQQLIEKYREQAATVGMSRSQLMAYQAAQMGVTAETGKSIATIKAHEDAVRAAAKAQEDAARSSGQLMDALKLLAAGYALLKVGEYIKDSALLAARYETLGVVMEVVGRNAGYTKAQMTTATESIAAQGITMAESRQSAIKLVQAHVDLRNASALARIAQDAAVIGNINSSESFDRLVNGIARGNTLILRNIGINVNLQAAYGQMADSLGKTTKELTENERVQARLNAVIERGSDINGTYTASMDTAGKQLKSMQRYTEDLKVKIGETFNEVLTVAVMAFTDQLKNANGEVSDLSKNGQLAQWGHDLTAVFVGVANAIDNILTGLKMAGTWAAHQSAGNDINMKFNTIEAHADPKATLAGQMDEHDRLERQRVAALAKEQSDYEKSQVDLARTVDRFQRAADERMASRLAKQKADAAASLKIDQDYAAQATAILMKSANEGAAAQEVARKAVNKLHDSIYVGTPNFRDTEGRESKPQVNRAESTAMADAIARMEAESSALKKHYADLSTLDEMYHKAGELSDKQFYANKHKYSDDTAAAQMSAYDKELGALTAHNNATAAEEAKTQKQFDDIWDKKTAAKAANAAESYRLDEEERLRQAAIISASNDANNKYISGLSAQAKAIELANGKHEKAASVIAEESAAQFRLAAAAMAVQAAGPADGGHTHADADAAKAMLATLLLQADAQERIAAAMRAGEAAAASKKLADMAIQDWQRAGQSIGDSLTNAFGAGGKALGGMFKAYAEGMAGQLRAQKELAVAKKLSDDNPEKIEAINRAQLAGTEAQLKSYGDMADAAQGFFEQGSKGYQAMHAASQVLHAAELALSIVKGVNAVLTQGEGDPYTAFARMAAMAAIVVGLGVAINGSGGGSAGVSSADRQKVQGTGTVLGDSTAKSDSVAKSIKNMESYAEMGLTYQSSMLTALQDIASALGGAAKGIMQTSGITGGSGFGTQDAANHSFFGTDRSTTVVDSGVKIAGTFGTLRNGAASGSQYEDVHQTSDGGWFHGSSTNDYTNTKSLTAAAMKPFTLIFDSMGNLLVDAGVKLGKDGGQLTAALNALPINFSVSLRNLKGQELADALSAGVSVAFDSVTRQLFPTIEQFQKMGEGLGETLVRVATDVQSVDSVFAAMGKSTLVTVLGTTETFGGTIRAGMVSISEMSIESKERLVEAAGGLDKFANSAQSFMKNFYADDEQRAATKARLATVLNPLGLSTEGANAQKLFKDFVLGLNTATPAGAATYSMLMSVQQAFKDVTDAASGQRKGLQDQLDQLTMSSAQLLAKQRSALDVSNRGLFDQVQALQKLKDAQDASKSSIGDVINRMKSFGESAKSLRDSLMLGTLSTLTPEQQYAESRRQRDATLAAARGGDATAQGQLSAMQTAFLTISQKINGGDSQYQADFAGVVKTSDELSKWAAGQVDVAQASLDALNKQVLGISDVAQGIQNLPTAIASAIDYSTMGTSNMTALVNEVKALRSSNEALTAEVQGLRADQNTQTGDMITGNASTFFEVAKKIISANKEIANETARNSHTGIALE